MKPTRDEAYQVLCEYNDSPALITHALAVEGVMRHFARLLGEDEEKWGVVGLMHDIDYQQFPEQHCIKAREILTEHGVDDDIIHAIQSHGYELCCDVKPEHVMEKVLYTIDELTGLINACAIMRPSRSVLDLELKSVKKKYKDHRFAAGVNREVIEKGAAMLNMDLDTIITETIMGMREVAQAIGLKGDL
ncbi:MAG: HDIG domain-containing metalloprotein [Candidatus Cryosericum sp.]|nr:HDIG domain-containing protein [bacterium]